MSNPEMADTDLSSPLMIDHNSKRGNEAIAAASVKIVEENKSNADYSMLLHYAREGNVKKLAEELTSNNQDVTKVMNKSGETLLHAALQGERTKMVDFLINYVDLALI